MGFLANYGMGQDLSQTQNLVNLAFHGLSETQAGIGQCQAAGKPVVLSIGGGAGNYGFTSAADAQNTAQQIWDLYLGGSSPKRPFGTAKLDGVDLDVENSVGKQYYGDFVDKLKALYATNASKKYYLTAVPQCPFPDANLGDVLSSRNSAFDYVLIQNYNNPPCDWNGSPANIVDSYSSSKWTGLFPLSKLVPTFPSSSTAAPAGGYGPPPGIAQALAQIAAQNFGLYSVAYDQGNTASGQPGNGAFWSEQVRSLAGGGGPSPTSPSATPSPSPALGASPSPSGAACPKGGSGDSFCAGKPQYNAHPCTTAQFVQCVNGAAYIQELLGTPSAGPGPVGKTGQFYADPCSNAKFVQCAKGITYVQSCGAGTVWDQSKNTCVAG
ncbi:hypothetical protein WJX72_007463 [[Myrmecia] bisecta]|uniref:chitinase n=1 Tax=[Myrmecia] bisecta TaxID=41462 RepID=A0AAW1Q0L9_9CHLO